MTMGLSYSHPRRASLYGPAEARPRHAAVRERADGEPYQGLVLVEVSDLSAGEDCVQPNHGVGGSPFNSPGFTLK